MRPENIVHGGDNISTLRRLALISCTAATLDSMERKFHPVSNSKLAEARMPASTAKGTKRGG